MGLNEVVALNQRLIEIAETLGRVDGKLGAVDAKLDKHIAECDEVRKSKMLWWQTTALILGPVVLSAIGVLWSLGK